MVMPVTETCECRCTPVAQHHARPDMAERADLDARAQLRAVFHHRGGDEPSSGVAVAGLGADHGG